MIVKLKEGVYVESSEIVWMEVGFILGQFGTIIVTKSGSKVGVDGVSPEEIVYKIELAKGVK